MTAAVELATWTTQEAAAAFVRAGCSVLRVKADGSKAPAGRWEEAQHQAADLATVLSWFNGGHPGVGVVTGAVSGNLEMLELEGRAVHEGLHAQLAELATASGLDELWQRVATGYREWTPSGGAHLLYRVAGTAVRGNTKLARRPSTPQELRDHQTREISRAQEQHAGDPAMLERRMQTIAALTPDKVPQVLVETRGEGGFVVTAPSGGPVHPTGRPWVLDCGSPDTIPTVTAEEYQALHDLARALDQMPQPEPPTPRPRAALNGHAGDVERPGDRFNRLASWHDLLLPHGWQPLHEHGGTLYWRRPGKAAGVSATTGRNEHDRLYVFSSSTEFEQNRPYDKLGALALLEHGGDIAAAARAIAADPRYRDHTPLTPDRFLHGAHSPPGTALVAVSGSSPADEAPTDPADQGEEDAYLAAVMADERRRDAGQSPWALQLAAEVDRQRLREEAARLLRRERADAAGEPTPTLLTDFLAVPDEEVAHRVEGLWPVGGRIVLAAQYKAGKTTLRDNLVRALVDDELFLGRFIVHPPAGRVVVIDNELDERMLRRWLRDQGVQHPERVAVLPLRGRVASFDLLDDDTRARWAAKLRAVDASVVLFDCLRPVLDALGLSEDKEAGRFLVAFDALLAEAGASEAVVVHHMGHAGERSRGDTRLRDWPDVEWQLVREKTEDGARRFFAAYGRDVEQPEGLLEYDHASRRLTLAGGTRRDAKADAGIPQVMAYLESQPGASQRAVEVALKDQLGGPKAARAALKRAVLAGLVDLVEGPRRSHLHFPSTPSAPSAPASEPAHPAHSSDECASAPIGGARRTQSADGPDQLDLNPAHSALTEDR